MAVGAFILWGMAIRLAREWRRKNGAIKFAVERGKGGAKMAGKGNILAGD